MRITAKAMPINDNDYNCHITAIELVLPIIWGLYHATNFIASGADTHTHTFKPVHTPARVHNM